MRMESGEERALLALDRRSLGGGAGVEDVEGEALEALPDAALEAVIERLGARVEDEARDLLPSLERLHARASEGGQARAQAWAALYIGQAHHHLGATREALRWAREAQALLGSIPDPEGEGHAINLVGVLWHVLGDTERARARFEWGLLQATRDDLEGLRATLLANLALTYDPATEAPARARLLRHAVRIFERLDDRARLAHALANLAHGLLRLERLAEALEACARSIELARAEGTRRVEALALAAQGVALAGQGRLPCALEVSRQALAMLQADGHAYDAARQACLLAPRLIDAGELEAARDLLRAQVAVATARGFQAVLCELLELESRALEAARDLPGALGALRRRTAVSDALHRELTREAAARERALQAALVHGTQDASDDTAATQLIADNHALRAALAREQTLRRELTRQATTDALTGVANRRLFEQLASAELERSLRHGTPMAAIAIDADRFKAINDHLGHAAGDAALVEMARRMRGCLRALDLLARVGGEEFTVVLPESDAARAREVAEHICHAMRARPIETRVGAVSLTISAGVAVLHASDDLQALLERADAALYRAKRAGRDQVMCARDV